MADQIKVTFGMLQTAVGDIRTGVALQEARMDDLRAAIAPMVATWEGSAQAAYNAAQEKWNAAWADLTAALNQFQAATDTSHTTYQAGESANTASWG